MGKRHPPLIPAQPPAPAPSDEDREQLKIGNSRTGHILAATARESATKAQVQRSFAAASSASVMSRTITESLWPVAQNSITGKGHQA